MAQRRKSRSSTSVVAADAAPLAEKSPAERNKLERLSHATDVSLDRTLSILAAPIDYALLVDPEWLADPENRKIAAVQLKVAAIQTNTALATISQQIRVDEEERRHRPNDRGVDEERLADLDWRLSGNEGPRPPGWRGVSTGHR
jgi:hypothetical protein